MDTREPWGKKTCCDWLTGFPGGPIDAFLLALVPNGSIPGHHEAWIVEEIQEERYYPGQQPSTRQQQEPPPQFSCPGGTGQSSRRTRFW
ncbi:unnamed protein product [Allacma fusca]|uniref:Uncharacterized protein n=1 Tax=Allacma fusca TaxID=39272 RepID=A0A8J2KPP4_9HEXA|nr:unnamed protein product [Allacma fusca]